MTKQRLNGGVYLVINPAEEQQWVLQQLRKAVSAGIAAVQIWNNRIDSGPIVSLAKEVINICRPLRIPVIINNDVELMRTVGADGVHFDDLASGARAIGQLSANDIKGITCGNDLRTIRWASKNQLDYISFCSMFPSVSADACELVDLNTIREANEISKTPLFISGGVTPTNMLQLPADAKYAGVAVISGIMHASDPAATVNEYLDSLKQRTNDT